jgi:hypothetical protein
MNIGEFVNSIQVQLSDLEKVGELGYVEGISNIITTNLKALDVTQRPIHCTDKKRETLYVKDEDAWEKENEENKKIKNVIHQVSKKNIQKIPDWIKENPHCKNSTSNKNDEYLKILCESMGGCDNDNQTKIIHTIAKEVIINK